MTRKKFVLCLVNLAVGAGLFGVAVSSQAQSGDKYKTRLAPAPRLVMDGQTSKNVAASAVVGVGSASAVLNGRKLTVTGSFENLASPATAAHLFLGPATGVRDRGNPAFDLTLAKTGNGNTGTISGAFDLSPAQVDALKKGRFYVSIHSEGMPSGHLLGWLLK
jgi:hypothetical protein